MASSFLQSMGQELIHSTDNTYNYNEDARYSRDEYQKPQHHQTRDRMDVSYDTGYNDVSSRDKERRSRRNRSKERHRSRDRPHHHPHPHHHSSSHRRSERDRDYRRNSRRSASPRGSRGSSRRRDEISVVPLHKRPRRLNNWDVTPPGMENMTASQVKQTGLFPLPGQVVGTKTPQSFAPPSEHAYLAENSARHQQQHHQHRMPGQDFGGQAMTTPPISSAARQARRLYVGQIPYAIDEQSTANFFNDAMKQMKGTDEIFVASVQINRDKNYAFVEFKTPEQATTAMAFDGIQFQGQTLKIRRPKDYQPPNDGSGEYAGPTYLQSHGLASVPDTPDKIFIGGLPTYLTDDQVVELLRSFGELKAFNLVKDTNGQSKGYAFCEYADISVTDLACQGLNNMELGEKKLIVQRASVGAKNAGMGGLAGTGSNNVAIETRSMMADIPFTGANDEDATRVLQLLNMVVPEELEDEEEYQDIWQDIAEECAKFGDIIDMKIPRPNGSEVVPGCGSIFVRFTTKEQTMTALQSLAGRKFADRIVVASYTDEEKYLADDF
ncbi:hypothetical protein BC941DRAFT_463605 [Chlamydoabsidia padenii]|nr:hypothetical protein BC941DRAFT_463605 [Chlamydoabsidia padenii]